MKKRMMLLMLSGLMVFTMSCALISNILGNVGSEVSELVMEEVAAVAEESEDTVEEQVGMDEVEAESTQENTESDADNADLDSPEEPSDQEPQDAASEPGTGMITSGPCYNPYFPIVEGRTMVYQNRIKEMETWESSHEMGFEGVSAEVFTSVFRYAELDIEGNPISEDMIELKIAWQCTEEGMLQQEFIFGNFGPVDDMVEISYETIEFNGVTFPSEENFVEGATWEANYVVSMSTTVDGTIVTSEIEIRQVNTVVGFEAVSVPYGDFPEALRVDSTSELMMTASADGGSYTIDSSSDMSAWYVKEIGMVKQDSGEEAYTYIQELAEIK